MYRRPENINIEFLSQKSTGQSCLVWEDRCGGFLVPAVTRKNLLVRQRLLKGVVLSIFSILIFSANLSAATYYLTTIGAAKAETPSNWNTGGTGGGGTAAQNFTTAGDVFIIETGIPATFNNTVFGSATAGVTLQINGTARISNGKTLKIGVAGANSKIIFTATSSNQVDDGSSGVFILDSGSTLVTANINGIIGANASITALNNGASLATDANYEFNGANQITTGLPTTVNNLTLSGSGSKTLTATQVNGTLLITGTVASSAGTSPTFGASGILRYSTTTNHTTGTAFPATFGGAQVVVDMAAGTTLTLNANRTLTAANLVINTGTLDLSTFTMNRGSAGGTLSISNGATLRIGGTNSFPANYNTHSIGATSTVDYYGTNQTVGNLNSSQVYGHLSLSGSGTKTLQTGTTSVAGNFTLSGTAAATAAVGLTIGGNLTIGATASFAAGSFTHNIAGNWSKSGTFNANTSTIVFNGTGATQTISGTNTFNNLTIDRISGGTVTASGSTLTVSGNLNVSAGTFAGASTYGNVTIASGTTLESEPNSTINVTGNWTNNGTFTANSGTVAFTGTSPQSIGGSSSTTFYNLTMNGTGLKTLGIATTVSNTLSLTSGKLELSTFNLTVSGSASGGSASSYVQTGSSGRMVQPVNHNVTKTFPVGKSAYNPMTILNNSTGGNDNFYVRVDDGSSTHVNDDSKTVLRKWYVYKDNAGTANLTMTFTYNTGETGASFNAGTTPKIAFYNGEYLMYSSATVNSTTFTSTGDFSNMVAANQYFVLGSDNAFSATKMAVYVSPASPTLGVAGSQITVRSLNSQNVMTCLKTATAFSVTATNTTTSPATLTGTIATDMHEAVIFGVAFTQATTDQLKATLTATQTSGEDLAAGTSEQFQVIAGRIFEPKTTGNWDVASNWRYSKDGGTTWRDTTAYPGTLEFNNLIRIPNTITLTANVTASFYSLLIETGGTLDLASGTLTLNHPEGNISGYDVHVHGTFKNSGGTFINSNESYPIEIHGGTYWHARDGGSLPNATWYSLNTTLSTCKIEGSSVGRLNQEFQNFMLISGTNSLTGNMSVSGVLTLTTGKITTGTYRVITTLTATIADNPGGWINGYLKRNIPTGSNISAFFPVGDAAYYAPVTLAAGTVSQSGSMEVSTSQPGVAPPVASGLSSIKYINRKWNTANQGIVYTNATATWTFNAADKTGNQGTVYLRRLAGGTWFVTGGSTDAASSNTITVSGLSYLGETASSEMYVGESTCDIANVWFGSFDTNWHDSRNWCSGSIPTSSTNVIVPGGITRYPVISSAGSVNSIEIMSGGSLSISGNQNLSIYGNFTSSGTFTPGTGTVAMVGTSQQTITGPVTFNNLTINNAAGVVAGSDFTVNGTLYAQSANPSAKQGTLHMVTYTVYMGASATNTGDGDVTGTTTRNHVFVLNTFYTYGHKHTGSRYFVATSLPTSVSLRVSIGIGQPGWTGTGSPANTLLRKYEPAQTGGANMRVYSRFFYKQSELPGGVDESTLAMWVQYPGPVYQDRGWFDYDVEENWLSISDENFTTIPSNLGDVQIAIAPTSFTLNTWLGGTSIEWNTAANWSQGHVPLATEGVIIPNASTTDNDPVLPSSPAAVAKFLILQPGSILNGGSGTITVYNDQVANVWSAETGSPSAGLFNAGTSTVIINSQNTFADISGATDFYNLSIPAGSKVRIGDDARTGILGTLTLAGTLDAASTHNYVEFKANGDQNIPNPNYSGFPGYHNLKISGTGTKTLPATLNMSCDFTNDGQVDALSNNSTVIFNSGVHNKAINIGGISLTTFINLTLNNMMGVNATQNITVNGALNLQAANPSAIKGNLDMVSGKVLTLGASSATVTGTGDITGTVTRSHVFQNGVFYYMTSANQWMVFTDLPSQTSNPLTVSVKLQIGAAPLWSGCSGTAISNPVNRVYTAWVSGTWGANARGNLRLRYLDSEITGGTMPYTLSIWRKTGISSACSVAELGKSNQDFTNRNLGIALLKMNDFATTEGNMEFAIAPSAATYLTWTGGAGTRDALTAGNWSPSNTPSASYRLFIPVANSLPMDGGVYRTPKLASENTLTAYSIELQDGGEITAEGNSTINLDGTGAVWISGTNAIFTPGTSTVNINTPGENSFVGTITFHNVDIKTGVSFFATNNVNITIGGTLTNNGTIFAQTAGNTFNFAGSNQTIPNTSSGVANYRTLVVSGSSTVLPATLNLNGNFTYSGSGMVTTGSTLTMMGTTAQTIGGTSLATFNNLTINNAAGVTLNNSQTVNGTLTLTSGLVTTAGTNTLTMGASGTISGASSSRYINGKLAHVYSGTGSKTFPVGKGGNYRPVILEYTELTATSTVTVEQMESTLPGTLPAGTTLFSSRYWNVTQSGYAGTYNITLDGTGYTPYSSSNVKILKGDGSSFNTYTTTYSSSNYTATGLTSFSYFGLGEYGTYWKGLSTDWFASTNWSSGTVPDATSAITIPSSTYYPVISSGSGDVTIGNGGSLSLEAGTTSLTVKTGAALTLASGATVTTGTGSKIILESDATYLNLGTSTPTLEVQRILTDSKGWRMVASPVGTTYAQMFAAPLVTQGFTGSTYPDLQPNLLSWAENDGGSTLQSWRKPASLSSDITAGLGHFFYVFNGAALPSLLTGSYTDALPKTMSATGLENYNGIGNFSFTITKTARTTGTGSNTTDATAYAANEGWNLVGNPTASTLNWDAGSGAWTKTNVDNVIYVWDPVTNNYLTWNGTTGTLGNGLIPPFQAFWVKAKAASPALSFNNSAKSATAGTFLKNAEINTIVNIPVSLKGLEMETTSYLSISENGVTGEDPFDAYRLQPMSDSWLALYMNSSPSANLPLVINHLPRTFEGELYIPLYVGAKQAGQNAGGNFALQWQIPFEWPSDLSITLMDHSQKKAINMLTQADYKFSQTVLKGASAAAIDPLALPTQQVVPTALPGGNTIGLKSAQIQPFAIVIGKNAQSEPIYQDNEAVLLPIAPNPVSDHAVIGFRLPEKATVRIDIFNSMGRLVETLASGEYYSGLTELNWVPRNLAPGVYVVRLTSGTVVKTQKIVRMK